MVSFCNIPLSQVSNFLYYGDYGIGLSQEWGIKNNISPVSYIHRNSPLYNTGYDINRLLLTSFTRGIFQKTLKEKLEKRGTDPSGIIQDSNTGISEEELIQINGRVIKSLQFSKYWEAEVKKHIILKNDEDKIVYEDKNFKSTINCYNEREWRFVPTIENTDAEIYPRIINSNDKNLQDLFKKHSSRETKKPHFSQDKYFLKFALDDLRYILVKENSEISQIIDCLKTTFKKENVSQKLESGNLIILTRNRIFQDF